MENKNIFIGKLQKNGCYVNNGKYDYFLTCENKIIRFLNGSLLKKWT